MIHLYKFKDLPIVLDVNSGAVHVVSNVVFDILRFFENSYSSDGVFLSEKNTVIKDLLCGKYTQSTIDEAMDEINSLINEGMLYTDDSHVTSDILEHRDVVTKAMCLHVAHDCNMQCRYCFADEGAFSGEKSMLSYETGKKAIDFLIKKSGSRRNLEIDFFGGEPLMNFTVVKKLVEYGRNRQEECGKNIRFTITTNGLLLDEEKDAYINDNMDNVILSIDGRKSINDRMRRTAGGNGTYDKIIENYKRFIKKREGMYYIRGTFTGYNLDFLEDVKHLSDIGFQNVSMEPVVAHESTEYAIKESDLPEICNQYEKLADYYLECIKSGKNLSFFHFDLSENHSPCVIKRVSGCGAGTEYVAVSPEGDIYPCHQFVGDKNFKIGNLYDETIENHLYDSFNRNHIYNKPRCRECWAKFFCSGGCHANAYHANGDMLVPYSIGCELERKRVECAIGIQAVLCE